MGEKIKYIDINEFRTKGYLQEANRQFFHPLGLALEIKIDEEGNETLGGIWDCREDPEGILYAEPRTLDEANKRLKKAHHVLEERHQKARVRIEKYGESVQSIYLPPKEDN